VELVLPEIGALVLRVRDARTRDPVSSFQVRWRADREASFERFAPDGRSALAPGPGGEFRCELPSGELELLVDARERGYRLARLEVLVDTDAPSEERVELEPGVELELRLHGPGGGDAQLGRTTPVLVTPAERSALDAGDERLRRDLERLWSLRGRRTSVLRGVAPGRYALWTRGRRFEFTPSEFDVPAVERHALEIVVAPRARGGGAAGGADGGARD
jgi:hypothetical protein